VAAVLARISLRPDCCKIAITLIGRILVNKRRKLVLTPVFVNYGHCGMILARSDVPSGGTICEGWRAYPL
jgi:hypothetical protein